jgi:hypothetical protein
MSDPRKINASDVHGSLFAGPLSGAQSGDEVTVGIGNSLSHREPRPLASGAVYWSQSHQLNPPSLGSAITIPTGYTDNEGRIRALFSVSATVANFTLAHSNPGAGDGLTVLLVKNDGASATGALNYTGYVRPVGSPAWEIGPGQTGEYVFRRQDGVMRVTFTLWP